MTFTETTFRKTVKQRLKELFESKTLGVAFQNITNGRMIGKSISEGGDVDVLYSPKGEVIYVDFNENIGTKIDSIKESLKKSYNGKDISPSSYKSQRIKLENFQNAPKS